MWLIKGIADANEWKSQEISWDMIDGSKGSQTIEELNTVHVLYKEEHCQAKLNQEKKSTKWEEFNVRELTLDEIDDYNFPLEN